MFTCRNTYRYIYTYVSLDRYIPSFYHLRNSLVAKSIPTAQILVSSTMLQSEETVFLREMVDSSSGQGIYKMNVEHLMGFPVGSVVKNPPANARDTGSIPGLGRSPAGGNGNPFLSGKSHGQRSLVGYKSQTRLATKPQQWHH